MKWNKCRIKTTTEAVDLISSMLSDLGVEGIEIEDKVPLTAAEKEQMFVDILPDSEADDGIAHISFYLETDVDKEQLLIRVRAELEELRSFTDVGAGTIEESETEDLDWINNWKQYFRQFYVDDILVIPSWEEVKPEDKEKLIIQIDPGTAFGTGMHETTQLCMRQIKKYIKNGDAMLDVGCGSGILSITGLKLGAVKAVGTDLDPCAITATQENMEVNGIRSDKYQVYQGNIIDDVSLQDIAGYERFELVTANILADVLVPLTPVVTQHMKKDAIYITSGIIKEKETEVMTAIQDAGLQVMEVNYQGDWVSITARK